MTPENNIKVENKVNKINSKVVKNVIRVGLVPFLLASTSCMPIEAIVTTPTPEVSPLPSDLTKTPELLPTEVPVELSPIVTNLATQELTLVSPTGVATEIPIITLAPEPTATAIPEPIATATLIPESTKIENSEDINKEEIVKNINEFLADEGKFSFEEMKKNSQYFYEESEFKDGKLPLGMITDWNGQFMLLGSIYDENNKNMRLFLGATDVDEERVVFEFNFKKHFEDENILYGIKVPIYQTKSSPASYIALENQDNMKLVYTENEWNDFVEEAVLKPITLFWRLESQEEFWESRGYPKDITSIDYDFAINYRIAIFNKIQKFGDALRSTRIPPIIDNETEADNLKCFWTEANFKGVDSLNISCPSANQIFDIAIRRP